MNRPLVPEPAPELAVAALSVLQDAVFVVDGRTILHVNERAADLLEEADPLRLVGRPFLDLVHPDDRPTIAERARKRLAGELVPNEYDVSILTSRGGVRRVHVRVGLAEVGGATLSFASVRERAESAVVDAVAVADMATALAHEIRNPLATIANSAASLRRLVPDGDATILLDCVDEEVARLGRIVRDLVDFARSPAVHVREESPVDLAMQALDLAKARRPGVSFRIASVERAPLKFPLDRGLVEQALVQLLVNAAEATEAGGEVLVAIQQANHLVSYEVRDRGPGLSSEASVRAFQPFFSTRAGGTGLGLPIARRIAQAHGGDVALESRADG
ncbi:MAG: PAS domain-containing protein, partial [Deltaproteobacteria bacterium]|nr:PAS domain-containing protein [Deltaproteobacteria bacterium]